MNASVQAAQVSDFHRVRVDSPPPGQPAEPDRSTFEDFRECVSREFGPQIAALLPRPSDRAEAPSPREIGSIAKSLTKLESTFNAVLKTETEAQCKGKQLSDNQTAALRRAVAADLEGSLFREALLVAKVDGKEFLQSKFVTFRGGRPSLVQGWQTFARSAVESSIERCLTRRREEVAARLNEQPADAPDNRVINQVQVQAQLESQIAKHRSQLNTNLASLGIDATETESLAETADFGSRGILGRFFTMRLTAQGSSGGFFIPSQRTESLIEQNRLAVGAFVKWVEAKYGPLIADRLFTEGCELFTRAQTGADFTTTLRNKLLNEAEQLSVGNSHAGWVHVPVVNDEHAGPAGLSCAFHSLSRQGSATDRRLSAKWEGASLWKSAWLMNRTERRIDNKRTIAALMHFLKNEKAIPDEVMAIIWKRHFAETFPSGSRDLTTGRAREILSEAIRLTDSTGREPSGIVEPPTLRHLLTEVGQEFNTGRKALDGKFWFRTTQRLTDAQLLSTSAGDPKANRQAIGRLVKYVGEHYGVEAAAVTWGKLKQTYATGEALTETEIVRVLRQSKANHKSDLAEGKTRVRAYVANYLSNTENTRKDLGLSKGELTNLRRAVMSAGLARAFQSGHSATTEPMDQITAEVGHRLFPDRFVDFKDPGNPANRPLPSRRIRDHRAERLESGLFEQGSVSNVDPKKDFERILGSAGTMASTYSARFDQDFNSAFQRLKAYCGQTFPDRFDPSADRRSTAEGLPGGALAGAAGTGVKTAEKTANKIAQFFGTGPVLQTGVDEVLSFYGELSAWIKVSEQCEEKQNEIGTLFAVRVATKLALAELDARGLERADPHEIESFRRELRQELVTIEQRLDSLLGQQFSGKAEQLAGFFENAASLSNLVSQSSALVESPVASAVLQNLDSGIAAVTSAAKSGKAISDLLHARHVRKRALRPIQMKFRKEFGDRTDKIDLASQNQAFPNQALYAMRGARAGRKLVRPKSVMFGDFRMNVARGLSRDARVGAKQIRVASTVAQTAKAVGLAAGLGPPAGIIGVGVSALTAINVIAYQTVVRNKRDQNLADWCRALLELGPGGTIPGDATNPKLMRLSHLPEAERAEFIIAKIVRKDPGIAGCLFAENLIREQDSPDGSAPKPWTTVLRDEMKPFARDDTIQKRTANAEWDAAVKTWLKSRDPDLLSQQIRNGLLKKSLY